MNSIHPKAIIGKGNSFGIGVKIGSNVKIGNDNIIGDYVVISGKVTIGNGNVVCTGSVLGGVSNHILRKNQNTNKSPNNEIILGNDNLLGEFVTIHSPVVSRTLIGHCISIGTRTHIAHDVIVENHAIISIQCGLGGYVRVLQGANIGIGVNIHPRIVIGQYSMIGLGGAVVRHILPGATVVGTPQRYLKPNIIGMERNGLSKLCIQELSSYLNKEKIEIKLLSSETYKILSYFFKILQKNKYVRNVPFIPKSQSIT
jgi:UDP-N-acetylglucosamine acyltransferase